MKRVGHLLEQIAEPDNLRLAFWKAARGKWSRPEVRRFAADLDGELVRMRDGLLGLDYPVGIFRRFEVWDPKRRTVHAAAFPERVLHHAIVNICEPFFEKWAIHDSYACRAGKGQWAALRQAERFAKAFPFFVKMDIKKFFDSVSHERLLDLLGRRLKDGGLLGWFGRIVRCYQAAPGRGLPIGSLTSQHFANFYLGHLDRYVKMGLRRKGYVRYMDDFVVWGVSGCDLGGVRERVEAFLRDDLALQAREHPYINRTEHGMDFLGTRVFPGYSTLNARSRRRFSAKLRSYERERASGGRAEGDLQRRMTALLGFACQVRSWCYRKRVLGNLGQRPIGLEPRESRPAGAVRSAAGRRQLEQRRPELPLGQSQQQRPGQPQQQPRVPCGPSSDPGRKAQRTEPAVVQSASDECLERQTQGETARSE